MTIIVGDLHHGRKHRVTYGDPAIWDYKSLYTLMDIIDKFEPDTLILAGDVFDTSRPTALAYSEVVTQLSRVPRAIVLAGNHDISKVDEDIAFDNLDALDNVTVVKYQEVYEFENFMLIGWQPTQEHFDTTLKDAIAAADEGSVIVTHCSRLDFGNANDNICTDARIKQAKEKDIIIVSGHEHKSSIGSNFAHLGSVVPHSISEVGDRYIWIDGKFKKLPELRDIVLTREEPTIIDPDKCYYVKTGKEITVEDLAMEEKDLSIDILEDFWKEAEKAGFSKEIIND